MPTLTDFYGLWALDPDRSQYDPGMAKPQAGVYTILPAPDRRLWFHARWTDRDDVAHHIAFETSADGTPEGPPAENTASTGVATPTVRSELTDDGLVTVVETEGQPVHTAIRTREGDDLVVTQRILTDEGFKTTRAHYVRTAAKQVLLYRRDLKMRKGKIAAQCAHASMAVFFRRNVGTPQELQVPLDGPMAAWVGGRFTKICLSVADEAALEQAVELAKRRGLPHALITDAGKTEFHGIPTRTAAAIGPAAIPEIDAITGPQGQVDAKLA